MIARIVAVVLVLLLAVVPRGAAADEFDAGQVRGQLVEIERSLDRTAREVASLKLSESGIQRLNALTLRLKGEVERMRAAAGERVEAQRGLLEALGRPAEGQAEAEEVAQKRKALTETVAEAEGFVHQGDLLLAKVEQILDRLSSKRIEALALTLAETKPVPVDPRNWAAAAGEIGHVGAIVRVSLQVWVQRLMAGGEATRGAVFALLLGALGWGVGAAGARLLRRAAGPVGLAWGGDQLPDAAVTRLVAAAIEWTARAAPWILGAFLAYRALPDDELLPNAVVRAIGMGVFAGVALFAAFRLLIRLVLETPGWRVAALDDAQAAGLARTLTGLAALVALDWAVVRAMRQFEDVNAAIAVWALVASAVIFWRMAAARRTPGWSGGQGWRSLRLLAVVTTGLAVPIAAVGFSTLAQYLTLGTIGSGLVLGFAAAARRAMREGLPRVMTPGSRLGERLLSGLALSADVLRLAEFWLSLLLELLILVATVVGLLLVWGATIDDVLVFWTRLLEGVRIGSYTFSLADVLLASLVFFVALSLTRYLQRVLDTRIFPRTALDTGVRHSLRSGLGYVGLVIAVAMSISTLGLNISNLAFVAGALSVGIGFGLQNIVNNFVSGLILLVERPIKQGDWVVVGANQGIVKRINVRATEIETFSRSTILVPNAEFLQTHVVNWTHKDVSARVEVTITILQTRGDAASLRDVMLACARARGDVLANPPPSVSLRDITADAYVFDVFCYTSEALRRGFIASELRFAIDAALRARDKA